MNKEKNKEMDRLVFFSDAVVAIAITLLALDLRIEKPEEISVLSFANLGHLWPKFSAFFLSFFLIAVFWKVHREFFMLIVKIDDRIIWYNIFWLLSIITLPFSTMLVSNYFGQTVSIFIYSVNSFLITVFLYLIWNYVAVRPDFLSEKANKELVHNYQVDCNVAMVNAVLAVGLSFVSPLAAFLVLFTRPLMMKAVKSTFKRRVAQTEVMRKQEDTD